MRKWKVDDKGQLRVLADVWRKAEWRECWLCGRKFPFPLNFLTSNGHNKGRFCSSACSGKWHAKLYKQQRAKKRCVICYSFFEVQPSKINRHKTCGDPACVQAFRRRKTLEYWRTIHDAT